MKVIVDQDAEETTLDANNYVIVVLPLEDGRERHVKVTHEGVIQEIVKDGTVLMDVCALHEDILEDCTEPDPKKEACIVLEGNLGEGFLAFGPYDSFDRAAESHVEGWVMSLNRPICPDDIIQVKVVKDEV